MNQFSYDLEILKMILKTFSDTPSGVQLICNSQQSLSVASVLSIHENIKWEMYIWLCFHCTWFKNRFRLFFARSFCLLFIQLFCWFVMINYLQTICECRICYNCSCRSYTKSHTRAYRKINLSEFSYSNTQFDTKWAFESCVCSI